MYTQNTQNTTAYTPELEEQGNKADIIPKIIEPKIKKARKSRTIAQSPKSITEVDPEQLSTIENTHEDKSPDPTDIYLKQIGNAALLSKDEEVHFARLALQGDLKAKNRMIESNLRLVVKIARLYGYRSK